MQTIWQLSAGDEKLIPALKIKILWDMADLIPYLVPTQFQESIFPTKPNQNYWLGLCGEKSIPGIEKEPHMELRPHCLRIGNVLARGCPSPHTTYDNDNSEIFKSFTWNRCLQKSIPQRNRLLTRNRFRGLMPGVLKSLKNQTLKLGLANIWFGKY